MPYIYLSLCVVLSATSGVFGTYFNKRVEGKKAPTAFYNFILLCAVAYAWLMLYLTDFSFEVKVLPFSLLFAFFYALCNISLIRALQCGPVALTSLFLNLSLILTSIWGLIFWDEPINITVILGLILVILSLFLCIYTKEKESISKKWLFYVALCFISNAGCSITQRTEQIVFDGQYGNMLMAFATALSLIFCFILYMRSDRSDSLPMMKRAGVFPILAGLCNVGLNFFVIALATTDISTSLIYPVIGVGGLAITLLFSQLAFKEKLRPAQWVGILAGAAATALLSL